MIMLVVNPLRRWWQAAFAPAAPAGVPASVWRRRPVSPGRVSAQRAGARPLTPFGGRPSQSDPVAGARRAARRFWMTLDPQDRRRAAIGGSFAEVCAALERLAAVEDRPPH